MGVINNYFQLLLNYFSDKLWTSVTLEYHKLTLNTDKDFIILGIILGCCKCLSFDVLKVECHMKQMSIRTRQASIACIVLK